jgi:lia operon protein LiaF
MNLRTIIFGVILILGGLILLGNRLEFFYISMRDVFQFFFPVALIFLGFWLIVRRHRIERSQAQAGRVEGTGQERSSQPETEPPVPPEVIGREEQTGTSQRATSSVKGKRRYSKTLGDIFIDFEGIEIQTVEVSSVIGDIEIKLHGGTLSPGLNRMVISGFIGDVRILVPIDMPVFAQCSSFIGDIELLGRRTSGFGNNIDGQTANYEEAESKLYIASNTFIGDARIYTV